ncbi:MAG: hypothetical protein RL180_1684 [Pseudomonadota bacterium]|jgi:plasmid stability protein
MANLSIRGLDDHLKARLRQQAAAHGWSMEEEVRQILAAALAPSQAVATGLGSRIHARFAALGDTPLDIPARTASARAADFDQ